MTMILVSPAARFYREYFTKKQELSQTEEYQSVNQGSPKEPWSKKEFLILITFQ